MGGCKAVSGSVCIDGRLHVCMKCLCAHMLVCANVFF